MCTGCCGSLLAMRCERPLRISNIITRDGTRTRNLLLRREAPYPLGHTSCEFDPAPLPPSTNKAQFVPLAGAQRARNTANRTTTVGSTRGGCARVRTQALVGVIPAPRIPKARGRADRTAAMRVHIDHPRPDRRGWPPISNRGAAFNHGVSAAGVARAYLPSSSAHTSPASRVMCMAACPP